MPEVRFLSLAELPYHQAWDMQRRIHAEVVAGTSPSTLMLCSHPHVYTLGRQTDAAHVTHPRAYYERLGAEVVEIDRGGSVTYHGPGQLVGYPVFRLRDFPCGEDLHLFLRSIEEALIVALSEFGIAARREAGKTGVWTERGKIAAIGLKCSRWVTMHGFALNVAPDVAMFGHVVPCGLTEPVSSLALELGEAPDDAAVRAAVLRGFAKVLACDCAASGTS